MRVLIGPSQIKRALSTTNRLDHWFNRLNRFATFQARTFLIVEVPWRRTGKARNSRWNSRLGQFNRLNWRTSRLTRLSDERQRIDSTRRAYELFVVLFEVFRSR